VIKHVINYNGGIGQCALWTSSCTMVNSGSITQSGYPGNGDVMVSFNAGSAGAYIIG
jgi:hypothetical protein